MRWVFLFAVAVLFFMPNLARAQSADGEVVSQPICFTVINETSHEVMGTIGTEKYTRPDGIKARHRSNFRLKAMGTTDPDEGYPTDQAEFCSYGPFYDGRQLDFTIRTLFPVFSCRTNVESGPIVITSTPRDDPMGGVDYSATCYN